jgi:hypothetical protein
MGLVCPKNILIIENLIFTHDRNGNNTKKCIDFMWEKSPAKIESA